MNDRELGKRLSTRQLEAVLALAEGRTRSQAAVEMGIAPDTFDNHLRHAYDKLGVQSASEAVVPVLRQLLSPVGGEASVPAYSCGQFAVCSRRKGHRGHHGGFRPAPILTPREIEVLGAISAPDSEGCASDAAAELGISEQTVKNHLVVIHRKLRVGTTTQAVAAAYEGGILP